MAAENGTKPPPFPKAVFFIIGNEFCERFTYYGMRTVLSLYLNHRLHYSDNTATVIFHVFMMLVYSLCLVGAIISDSWLGKFKTILYLSLVYVSGSTMLSLGAIPPLNLPEEAFAMTGLALIALGSGGIKPCVSAFGGDQFKLPEQDKQLALFFSMFYFAINLGSLLSTMITPILREDVHCFGEKECYALAFGVPAVLMALSIVIFVLGRPLYKNKPPAGNMVVMVSKCIGTAISTRCRESRTNPREHWLDYADQKYEKSFIDDTKALMRIIVLYLPLPMFWALFDQQGSRWTFQAKRMDRLVGSWNIKPDQMQTLNPLMILILIPLFNFAFYPALWYVGIRRRLQKLIMGGILAGVAFVISGLVELKLESSGPKSLSILWQIPQYVVITMGEVMFSVTGLEFSYSEAPSSLKSVVSAYWLLTVAFGNVIVAVIAGLKFFDSQAIEFFLFAGLMFLVMAIFTFMAYRYKPNNPSNEKDQKK